MQSRFREARGSLQNHTDGWRGKVYALGWFAISIYAFFWLIDLDISRAGESLFILCFAIAWWSETESWLKWHRIFLLLLAFVVLQIGVYFFAAERFPDFADDQIKSSRHVAKLFLCIAVAWWLRGSVNAAKYLIAIFFAGFLVSLLFTASLEDWVRGFQGRRLDFGYKNAQHTAVYFGLAFIVGLSLFLREISHRMSLVPTVVSIAAMSLGGAGILVTQTRSVWLAIAITLIVVTLAWSGYALARGSAFVTPRRLLVVVFGVVVMAGLAVTTYKPFIEPRMDKGLETLAVVMDGEKNDLSYAGLGVRIRSWDYALDRIEERPLTGWGPQSRKPLIDEGPFPDRFKKRFGHFHNSYLELTLAYGAVGVLLLGLLIFCIMKGVFRLAHRGHFHLFLGLSASWVFFAFVNLFESYLIFRTGMYFFIFIGGVGMSFYIFGVRNGERHPA